MNTIGNKFVFTSFGESHGRAIGGVLDGVDAGVQIDLALIRQALDVRSGRTSTVGVSARAQNERDDVEWLSGVLPDPEHEGQLISEGTPIAFIIRNTDARPQDYEWLRHHLRSAHADYTYEHKYGIRDVRGGGRASARETVSRVVAGSIAQMLLRARGIQIRARVIQIGDETDSRQWETLLADVQRQGDSVGGIVECTITGLPIGLGEPVFDKLQSHLAYAMMSINGCKGFEYGTGFDMTHRGSELYHDVPCPASGGIEGGLSNGLPLVFRCAFKPAASIAREGHPRGRHDACIALRAVGVVEAMSALVIRNFWG